MGTLQETLGAAMCEISLRNVVSIFTGRGAVESLLNSGGRKIKLWGEDRSGRAKCEMRGEEIMAPTQNRAEIIWVL